MDSFPKIKSSQLLPPFPSYSDSSSFPIIPIAIIAILATSFLLLTNCLLLHRRRLSLSSISPATYSPATDNRGLQDSLIRSIPVIQYNKSLAKEQSSSECAVCLAEFEDDETLRVIPICSHLFHIDCIDIWLQNNPNCPFCRTTISTSVLFHQFPLPCPSPEDTAGGREDESDFVVIEMGGTGNDPSDQFSQEWLDSGELPAAAAGKLEQGKMRWKVQKVTSSGDEVIDTREKDERFCVQQIRRSISMDSSAERRMYTAVQAVMQQSSRVAGASPGGDGCNGRGRRSLFYFGTAQVKPVRLEES